MVDLPGVYSSKELFSMTTIGHSASSFMMTNGLKIYDLVVIGGGPAGITAATAASRFGKGVALVDCNREIGVHIMGELATEVVHIGLVAMMGNAIADLFIDACFNLPTLGLLYKTATLNALGLTSIPPVRRESPGNQSPQLALSSLPDRLITSCHLPSVSPTIG